MKKPVVVHYRLVVFDQKNNLIMYENTAFGLQGLSTAIKEVLTMFRHEVPDLKFKDIASIKPEMKKCPQIVEYRIKVKRTHIVIEHSESHDRDKITGAYYNFNNEGD